MTTVIKIKRSEVTSAVPTLSDIEVGEVALNSADRIIYVRNSADDIIPVANYIDLPPDILDRLNALQAALAASEYPIGDYGDLTGQLSDAFGIPLSITYDCLTAPAGTLYQIDLGTL